MCHCSRDSNVIFIYIYIYIFFFFFPKNLTKLVNLRNMETSWNYKKELKPQGSVLAIDLNPRSGFAFRPNFILKNERPHHQSRLYF